MAEHRTPLKFLDAITVETVRFERPSRVAFALLRGPVPHVQETFELLERDGATTLTYRARWAPTSGCSGAGTGAVS